MAKNMETLVNHLKTQGFVFQGSEIYGGLANSWDYGPLGVEVKNKLKQLWWNYFIKQQPLNIGLDSSIILNPQVWKTSGHVDGFNDPLIDCKKCNTRFRADKMIEEFDPSVNAGVMTNSQLEEFIAEHKIACAKCKSLEFTSIRQFGLMFKTNQGVLEDESSTVYLRPETAQGIFINFKNAQRSLRKKLPFGIGQIGKSFRNEITPGNFIFRTREFEQMELEFFFNPNDDKTWFEFWVEQINEFLTTKMEFARVTYRIRAHEKDELAHYSKQTSDFEFNFPFGWGELWGVAHRGDFDLNAHQTASKQDLTYLDPITNEKILPHVIEPSVGVERLMLALLWNAYDEETLEDGSIRAIMHLPFALAPYQVAIMPLQKQQNDKAYEIYQQLVDKFDATYDDTGNIGKRYRRQDAIGTPFAITIDFDTQNDNKVTIRNRDTMEQSRVDINKIEEFIRNNF